MSPVDYGYSNKFFVSDASYGFSGLQYVIAAIEGTKKKGKKLVKVRKLSGIPLYLKQADIKEQIEYVEKEEKLSDVLNTHNQQVTI